MDAERVWNKICKKDGADNASRPMQHCETMKVSVSVVLLVLDTYLTQHLVLLHLD